MTFAFFRIIKPGIPQGGAVFGEFSSLQGRQGPHFPKIISNCPAAHLHSLKLTRAQLGGGCFNTHPWGFFAIAKKMAAHGGAQRRRFLQSCSDNSSATFLKILGPGHQRSGQVTPLPKQIYNRVTATVVERKIWNFQDLVYYQVSTTCIGTSDFTHWWLALLAITWNKQINKT